MINIAIKSGDKVNAVGAEGDTPLLTAVRLGKHKAVKALLKNKADAAVKDAKGLSPMHLAADGGFMNVILALLTHGLDPNEPAESDGLRPLHRAVINGHTDACKALLNAEVPPDQPTADGKVPTELTENVAVLEVLKKFGRTKDEV